MSRPEDASRGEIEGGQLEQLRGLVGELWEKNAFWRAKFEMAGWDEPGTLIGSLGSREGVAGLPLLHKDELVADQLANPPYGTNLSEPLAGFTRLHQTSGTTGRPMRWLDTPASWARILGSWEQIYRIAGVEAQDVFCFPFSFGPFIGFWAAFEGAARMGHLCLPGGGLGSLARLQLIEENAATVVCCTPTYALRLAEVAREAGDDLAGGSVRMLIVAGEPGGSVPAVRGAIERAWGARVIDHWGMTELGPIAVECHEGTGGMHVLETECLAEVIDPDTAEAVATGERGELVITTLGRTGSPVLRFRTGDLVEVDPDPCACGRSLLRLRGGILGRLDDMMTIRGNNVFPSSIEAVLREVDGVVEFRVEVSRRREMDHVEIQVEPAADADAQAVVGAVAARIKERLNFQAEVTAVAPGGLPRFELKGRRFFRLEPDPEDGESGEQGP